MLEMAGIGRKWLKMAGNGCNLPENPGKSWNVLEIAEIDRYE